MEIRGIIPGPFVGHRGRTLPARPVLRVVCYPRGSERGLRNSARPIDAAHAHPSYDLGNDLAHTDLPPRTGISLSAVVPPGGRSRASGLSPEPSRTSLGAFLLLDAGGQSSRVLDLRAGLPSVPAHVRSTLQPHRPVYAGAGA